MTEFLIDPEHTLRLARTIHSHTTHTPYALPHLPGGPLAEFCAALSAAVGNVDARDKLLRSDLDHVVDIAVNTTHAAQATDNDSARALSALEVA